MTSSPDVLAAPARSLAKAAVGIGVVTVAARLVGFARGVVLVRTVGATCVGDTYYAANSIPNILFETVAGGALASAVVPLLARPLAAGDDAQVRRIASALLTWAIVVLVPVALAGALLATPIMRLLAGSTSAGYDRGAVVALGARMLLVFMPQVVLYGVGVVLTGVLQAHRRFLGPAVAPLLSSLVVMTAYGAYAGEGSRGAGCAGLPTTQELTLSVGTTLGVVALSGSLLVPLRATGVRLRPTLSLPPGVGRRFVGLAGAGVAALAAQQLALAVVLRLSYGGPPGTIVLYGLAWTVFLLPWAVLALPIATSSFPELAGAAEAGDDTRYAGAVALTSRAVLAVSALAVAVLVAVAAPLSRLLVLHAAGRPDPGQLALALVAFAPGLLGYGLVAHLTRALYARHAGARAALATVAGWAVVVAGDLVAVAALPGRDTLVALGIGTSIGLSAAGLGLVGCLFSVAGASAVRGLARTSVAAGGGAAVGACGGWWLAHGLPGRGLVSAVWQGPLLAAVAAAAVVLAVGVADRKLVPALWARR